MIPTEKIRKDGEFKIFDKKKVVIKDCKSFTVNPVHDETMMLNNGQFFMSIFLTALRIESDLKNLYFRKFCKQTNGMHHQIVSMNFNQIIEFCRSSGIINMDQFDKISMLRKARNEIAHHPYVSDRYIDEKKCRKIVEPSIEVLGELHDKLVKLSNQQKK